MWMLHLTLLFFVTACGADPSADDTSQPIQVQAAAKPEPEPDPAPPEAQDDALFVSAAQDLGPCHGEAHGRVVYVTTERAFHVCEATGEWAPLDLKGDAGRQGDPGPAGAQGPKGDDGTPGDKGDDGQTVTDSMWWDPIGERWWTFTAATTPFAVAAQSCTGDWRLPTAEEFIVANARGLRVVATSNFEAWLQDGTHVRYDGQTLSASASPYCVEEDAP